MKEVFVFRFQKDADNEVLETLIATTIRDAEHYFGEPRVRVCTSYLVTKDSVIINISSDDTVSDFIIRVLTGNLSDVFGGKEFSVERKAGKRKEPYDTAQEA